MTQTSKKHPDNPVQRRHRRRRLPIAAPIAGAVLLVAGGATVFWWVNRNTFTPGTLPLGANLIPQNALMVLTLNTDAQQWQKLRSFGTSNSQKAFDKTLIDLRNQVFSQNGINYNQDIAPWVGPEVSIAQLSPQSELSNAAEAVPSALSPQPTVVVLPIGDPLRANEVFNASPKLAQRQWSERTYKDVKIREAQPQKSSSAAPKPPLQMAIVENRLVVVTNSARSMNQVIDSFRDGKQSLARTPGYISALGQIQQPVRPFLTLYRNIPGSMVSAAENSDQRISKTDQDWIDQAQGWATVANLQDEGIELRNIAWLKPDSQRLFGAKNQAKSLHSKLPDSTLTMVAGADLAQFWQDYRRDYITYPLQPFNPNRFEQALQDSIGLSWEKDFLSWMKGEFTIAMVPMPGAAATKMPIGLVALIKTNNRGEAEKSLQQLDNLMISRQGYQVAPGKFNNEPVVNWRDPLTGNTVTRGWMNDDIAFFSLGTPITGTFFPNVQASLNDHPKFRRTATTSLNQTKPNANGFVFVNVEQIFAMPTLPPLLRWLEPYRDFGEAVQAFGMNAVTSSDRTIRFDAFVKLQQGATAGPLPTSMPKESAPSSAQKSQPK